MTIQLPLFPESEQPRKCIIDGEEYASVLDMLEMYGKSSNPDTDWRRIKEKLEKQGYKVADLILYHRFPGKDGKLHRPTPVVNKVQIARIAQITDYPEWEPIRQRMAEIFVEAQTGQPLRTLAARKYRQLRNAGYDNDRALEWHERDNISIEAGKLARAEWHLREGSIPKLVNHSTRLVLGKSATAWKKEHGTNESPRRFMSTGKKVVLAFIEGVAVTLHRRRDSRGTDALAQDLTDASQIVDQSKVDELFPDMDIEPPPAKDQPPLLPSGE
jgi:hypothetical protein